MTLAKYASYKDSGLEWLGEIPSHWKIGRLRHFATVQTGIAKGKDNTDKEVVEVPYLRVANVQDNFLALDDLATIKVPPDTVPRYLLQDGDVLMNEGGDVDKLGRGCIWRNEIPGCIHQNHVFAVRPHAVLPEWLNLITGSAYAQFYFMTRAKQSTNLASISSTNIMELPLVLPPAREQSTILEFISRETGKISALITEQEKLITLLAEKRQATISHAVTKGLNPDAPMKDSGVVWLGEVPAHWEVRRLKTISPEVTVGIVVEPSKYYVDAGIPALRSLNVAPRKITEENLVYISEKSNELLTKSRLRAGDLVCVRTGQPGATAVVPVELDGCNCIDLIIIRKPINNSEIYLSWFFSSDAAVQQFSSGSGGAIQQHFNVGMAMNLQIPLPPLTEQRAIVDFLAMEITKLDALQAQAKHAITLLQERRTALITAAVTGKIDVRGAMEEKMECAEMAA